MTRRSTNTITVEIHKHLRLGQAIINALKASGDLDWYTDPKTGKLIYNVTGVDLFYMSNEHLLGALSKDARTD